MDINFYIINMSILYDIEAVNEYLISKEIHFDLPNYFKYICTQLRSDINNNFIEFYLTYLLKKNEFNIKHNKLNEFKIMKYSKTKNIKEYLNQLNLKENLDYKINSLIESNKQNNCYIKSEFLLTPNAFKLCVLKSKNNLELTQNLLFLEDCNSYYKEYTINFQKLRLEEKNKKLDELDKNINNLHLENKDQLNKIKKLSINNDSNSLEKNKKVNKELIELNELDDNNLLDKGIWKHNNKKILNELFKYSNDLDNINSKISKFKLSKGFIFHYKDKIPPFGFNGLGELVYMRTYSRIKPDNTKEKWYETVERVVNGTYNMQKEWMISQNLGWNELEKQKEAKEMYDCIFHMKFLPPGRGLWTHGTKITEERRLFAALNNCAFVSTENIDKLKYPSEPFCFLMDASMLGVGVGFDTKGKNKITIKNPKPNNKKFIIPDSREGWVESLKLLLDAYFLSLPLPEFDYSSIRKEGEPIKGFGGVSSGYKCLESLHKSINEILNSNINKQISPRIITDIMNLIGKCVVSGNVRRSAEIAFGEYDDEEFINLKNYEKNPERLPFGWASNNSIFAKLGMNYHNIAERIKNNGEPGLMFLENMQNYGRMNGVKDTSDYRVKGGNPCVSGNTWTMTKNGPKLIKNLINNGQQDVIINGKSYKTTDNGFFYTGNKITYKLSTNEGYEVVATDNHQIKTVDRDWVELSKLKNGDKIVIMNHKDILPWNGKGTKEEGYLLGHLIGDGTFNNNQAILSVWGDENITPRNYIYNILNKMDHRSDWKGWSNIKERHEYRIRSVALTQLAKDYDIIQGNKYITDKIEEGSYEFYIGILQGLFDTDGSVQGDTNKGISVRLSQANFELLQRVQRMLNRLGIYSTIYKRAECSKHLLPDGKEGNNLYDCKELYELIITKSAMILFNDKIGFIQEDKKNKLIDKIATYKKTVYKSKSYAIVSKIEKIGHEDVYDCTVPEMTAFDANGIYVHNCLEQSLESYELCCLVEVIINNNNSLEEFLKTLKYAFIYAKTVTLGSTHWEQTNKILKRNRRIGTSMTGITQFIAKNGIHTLKNWCETGYDFLKNFDTKISEEFTIPKSVKITSIKPSGTVSLLAGATAGVHFPESRFYIRRMRLDNKSELIEPLKNAGYKIEIDHYAPETTMVVEIPVDVGENVRTLDNVTMWEQLALVSFMQRYWSCNQVSATITFDKEKEGDQIPFALDYYQYSLKGISFLPRLKQGQTIYPQQPYEKINENIYNNIIENIKPINFNIKVEDVEKELYKEPSDKFCSNDKCMI